MHSTYLNNDHQTRLQAMLECPLAIYPPALARLINAAASDKKPPEQPPIRFDGRVGIVPVRGAFGWDTGYGETQSRIMEASQKADWIVLDINSPGGTVQGVEEFAEWLVGFGKPVVSYTSGVMASAAYYIGAATEMIGSSRTAIVGSIGVISQVVELSKMFEDSGIKIHTFTSGTRKATGNPYTPMTDDHKAQVNEIVSDAFASFSGFVESRRPQVSREMMDGRYMFGTRAAASGLVDGVFPTIESFINEISQG